MIFTGELKEMWVNEVKKQNIWYHLTTHNDHPVIQKTRGPRVYPGLPGTNNRLPDNEEYVIIFTPTFLMNNLIDKYLEKEAHTLYLEGWSRMF